MIKINKFCRIYNDICFFVDELVILIMILKYLGCVLAGNESENRAVSIAWSPNNLKLAVALADRSIYLFDETGVKKDRFSTKPVDSKVYLFLFINYYISILN